MSIDAIRAAFEAEFPRAIWDGQLQGYTEPMYTYALAGYRAARATPPAPTPAAAGEAWRVGLKGVRERLVGCMNPMGRASHYNNGSNNALRQAVTEIDEVLNGTSPGMKSLAAPLPRQAAVQEVPSEPYAPRFDEAEFDAIVEKGTKAWAVVPDNWLEIHRGNEVDSQEAPSKKPFAGPGEWFSVGILGAPMREYEPGKWESATWPSDVAKGAAKLDRLEFMINNALQQPAQAVPDAAARLNWMLDWYLREGKRAEFNPHGHVTFTTKEMMLAAIDSALFAAPEESGQ